MLGEHPRGAGPLVGRQLRYLVDSEHGWLGGLALASAALQLQDRDRWIGWDVDTRRAQLDRVVGLSRLLIRPSVRCQNLASRVLALALQRLPEDFAARYGYQPWLVETFVDTRHVAGTCFRAANWIRVGAIQGRGRQDRDRSTRRRSRTSTSTHWSPTFGSAWACRRTAAEGPCRSVRVWRPTAGRSRSSAARRWAIGA